MWALHKQASIIDVCVIADISALMKKAMSQQQDNARQPRKEATVAVYQDFDDKENAVGQHTSSGKGKKGLGHRRPETRNSMVQRPARYGDWFDGDDAELEKMVDEFNDEQVQQGNKKDGSDVARHVREIADGLCSQLDSLIDESELEGSADEQSLRDKLLESWEGKSYYDRLLQMTGSNETTSTLIQKSLEKQGKARCQQNKAGSPSDSSDSMHSTEPLLSPPKRRGHRSKQQSLEVKIPDHPLIPEEALTVVDKNKKNTTQKLQPSGPGLLKVSARGSKAGMAPWETKQDSAMSRQVQAARKQLRSHQGAYASAESSAKSLGMKLSSFKEKPLSLKHATEIKKEYDAMHSEVQSLLAAVTSLASSISAGRAQIDTVVTSLQKD